MRINITRFTNQTNELRFHGFESFLSSTAVDGWPDPAFFMLISELIRNRPLQNFLIQTNDGISCYPFFIFKRVSLLRVLLFVLIRYKRYGSVTNSGECSVHLIVVFLGNGIELMIMATGTGDSHSEKSFSGGVNYFVQGVGPNLCLRIRVLIIHIIIGTSHKESTSDYFVEVVGFDYVTCYMLSDQLVEWFVLID